MPPVTFQFDILLYPLSKNHAKILCKYQGYLIENAGVVLETGITVLKKGKIMLTFRSQKDKK